MRYLHRFLISLALACAAAHAAVGPYAEGVDARAAITQAQAQARQDRLPLLVVFGANWCGDCKVLDLAMTQGTSAALMARDFRVVKVDVGRFDRNVDIAAGFEVPLKKGIPAVAMLSAEGQLLYATRAGELADARRMGDAGIHDFFQRTLATHRPKAP